MTALPTPTAVAAVFVSVLKEWLNPVEFLTMRMLNAVEEEDNVCHSHDFCDANEAMAAAFEKLGADPLPDIDVDDAGAEPSEAACAATALWNEAWEKAMSDLGRGARSLETTDAVYVKVDDLWWHVAQRKIVTQGVIDSHTDGKNGVGIMVYGKAREVAHA